MEAAPGAVIRKVWPDGGGRAVTIMVSHGAGPRPCTPRAAPTHRSCLPSTLAARSFHWFILCVLKFYRDVILLHILFCQFLNTVSYFQALPCSFSLVYLLCNILL